METVLAWDVFRGRFDEQLDLKSQMQNGDIGIPESPLTSPVGETIPLINSLELESCNRLLDSFLTKVHIANPILDVDAVLGYVRHACLHGIGWDAQSCLVVSYLRYASTQNPAKPLSSLYYLVIALCLGLNCRGLPRQT